MGSEYGKLKSVQNYTFGGVKGLQRSHDTCKAIELFVFLETVKA